MNRFLRCMAVTLVVAMALGCNISQTYMGVQTKNTVLVSDVLKKSFDYRGLDRNPVIVVHGLMGAKLADRNTGKNVWGVFNFPKMANPEHWRQLALPMIQGKPLIELTNQIDHHGLLEESEIATDGGVRLFNMSGYDLITNQLKKYGYRDEKDLWDNELPTLFLFDYDWRRDISENAIHLDQFIREKTAMLEQRRLRIYGEAAKEHPVKFDIIAHSMGGLVSRYYIQYGPQLLPDDGSLPKPDPEAAPLVEKLMIVGTPNAGYLDTVLELVRGVQLVPGAPVYPPAVFGTFASMYFMMPHLEGKHLVWSDKPDEAVDIYDPEVWIQLKWGLANPDQDVILRWLLPDVPTADMRREIALDHLRKNLKRAKQFTSAMRVPLPAKSDRLIFLYAGDAFETNRTASVDRKDGKVKVVRTESGDGKVLAISARFDLRDQGDDHIFLKSPIPWDGLYYFGASHMGLFNSSDFATNLSSSLFYESTPRQKSMRDDR